MNVTAFFTSLITWFLIFPSAALCYEVMKNQIRYSVKKTTIVVIITYVTTSLIVALLKSFFDIPRNALIPVIIIPSFIMYVKTITAPIYKTLSVAVLVFAFMTFFVNIQIEYALSRTKYFQKVLLILYHINHKIILHY